MTATHIMLISFCKYFWLISSCKYILLISFCNYIVDSVCNISIVDFWRRKNIMLISFWTNSFFDIFFVKKSCLFISAKLISSHSTEEFAIFFFPKRGQDGGWGGGKKSINLGECMLLMLCQARFVHFLSSGKTTKIEVCCPKKRKQHKIWFFSQ